MQNDILEKPQPHPTPMSQPYWDGLAAGRLMLQKCAHCGKIRHYPRLLCDACYSRDVEWITATGRGKVHSWTISHHAFHPAFKRELPYTLVTVDLAEGVRAMGRFVGKNHVTLRLGLPLRLAVEPAVNGIAIPSFVADTD